MVLNIVKSVTVNSCRTFKNFGHVRQPTPVVTFLWHGFLTFTFIGLGIEWKKIAQFFFGDDHEIKEAPWEHTISIQDVPSGQEESKT